MPTKRGQPQRTAWTRRSGESIVVPSLVIARAHSLYRHPTVSHPLPSDHGTELAGRGSNSTWNTAQRIQRS